MYLFRHFVGLVGRVISSVQGPYLHMIAQHREMPTNIHTSHEVLIHVPSIRTDRTHALDGAVSYRRVW